MAETVIATIGGGKVNLGILQQFPAPIFLLASFTGRV
jgi:hypothetical protein